MRIGFSGFGEAAFHIAKGLREQGITDLAAFDSTLLEPDTPARRVLIQRLEDTRIEGDKALRDMVARADRVFLTVPASASEEVGRDAIACMKAGQILVDVCAAGPEVKEALAAAADTNGVGYVDCAMLGPVPVYGHEVPMAASGTSAAQWRDEATKIGMKVDILDGPAGQASRLKLSRSLFTKGFEALLVETFLFARKNGVEAAVMDSLEETLDRVGFRQSAERYLAGDLVHAKRRAHELESAVAAMEASGQTPLLLRAAVARLETSAQLTGNGGQVGEMPGSLQEVYDIWARIGAL